MEIHKTIFLVLGLVLVFALGYVSGGLLMGPQPGHDRDLLYQVSTYSALAGGAYAPVEPVRVLMGNGDLGLGTFEGLDGEMVVVDGTCYQVKSDGIARPADPSLGVPFAAVTFFSPDITVPGIVAENLTQLDNAISARLPDPNLFYAIRIDGTFPDIRVRSVPAQSRPYPPLADALTHQVVYEYHNVTGTVVGFYTPASAAGLNVVGYHFHFITTDRNRGGHVLDIAAAGDTAELDPVARYTVVYTAGDNGS
ncbi:MAG TPA: acetolactate decarboxylase [Methanomicrobiales archaeon]|nr:acetolactate decarboxylase [Methanomicrobiales archaeon]